MGIKVCPQGGKLTKIIRLIKNQREFIIEAFTDVCLVALPWDILYLYRAGGWYEPNRFILIVELTMLPAIMALGVWRFCRYLKRKEGKGGGSR